MTSSATKTNPKAKKKVNNSTLAERTAKRQQQENQWQQYNAVAKFIAENMQKSLEELAKKTFPTDGINRMAYQEAIAKSLVETLSPEIGVKDFWKKMNEAECKELRIEEGHLSFYKSKKQKIDITPYTQAIVFEAHSSLYEQRMSERKERIMQAQIQLQELISEIQKNRKQ